MNISKIKIILILAFFLLLKNSDLIAQKVVTEEEMSDTTDIIDEDYVPMSRSANTVTGRWYGIGNVITSRNTNSYLCELILNERKDGSVTGFFNYFFREGYFSVRLKGTYKKELQQFKFNPLIVLFHQTTKASIGVDVAMSGNFFLNVLRSDTSLTGFLMPTKNDKYLVPPINVKFSKLPKNAPSLKERVKNKPLLLEGTPEEIRKIANGELKHHDTLTFANKADTKTNSNLTFNNQKSSITGNDSLHFDKNTQTSNYTNDNLHFQNKDNLVKGNDSLTFGKNANSIAKGNDTLHFNANRNQNKQSDSLYFKKKETPVSNPIVIDKKVTVEKQLEDLYRARKNTIAKDFIVKDDSVTVQLYDNGEYDKDVVSVFFNGKVVVAHKELSTRIPIKFVVKLSKGDAKNNELTLFADNLGEIPPNSALMIVTDTKGNRYEVNLDSDFSKNASILLKVQD